MKKIFTFVFCLFLTTACAPLGMDTVKTSGQVSPTEEGVVVSSKLVKYDSSDIGIGTITGAAAGGIAGSSLGGNTQMNMLGALGGAVAGGMVGKQFDKNLGTEYIIRFNSGRTSSVIVRDQNPLPNGARVLVIFDKEPRVVPVYY